MSANEEFKSQYVRLRNIALNEGTSAEDRAAIIAVMHQYNRMLGALKGISSLVTNSVVDKVIAESDWN